MSTPNSRGSSVMVDKDTRAWQHDALYNLSQWRSSLFQKTMLTIRDKHQQYGNTERMYGSPPILEQDVVFGTFNPTVTCPPGSSLQRLGGSETGEAQGSSSDDGGKWLCMGGRQLQPPCVIYSLGSNGDFSFEEAMLKATPCNVVTFDCTVPDSLVKELPGGKHKFMRKCIGSEARMKASPDTFVTLHAVAQELGHARIDLLKCDIEGYEFDLFSSIAEHDGSLPSMISMELHASDMYWGTSSVGKADDFSNLIWPLHTMALSELSLFAAHMANLGYASISNELNPGCEHCTEVTWLRLEQSTHSLPQRAPKA